jgi:hypothetical protein
VFAGKTLEGLNSMIALPKNEDRQNGYTQYQDEIPSNLLADTLVSIDRSAPRKIYTLGFQPAKSIPEIPRWFLRKYVQPGAIVCDPFAGSGTTLLESIAGGVSAFWLDYHPLSRLLCSVKTRRFPTLQFREEVARIVDEVSRAASAPETVQFANKDFWFQKPVQEALELLREGIAAADPKTQPLLWVAFAATARKASNMNDGMLLAARRPNIKDIPERSRLDVISYFTSYADRAAEAAQEWEPVLEQYQGRVLELPTHDARELASNWMCDAIVTSPPYINAIDYVWASKFELHWLGMVKSDQDRLDLYAREIGTERISAEECKQPGRTGHLNIDRLVEAIFTGRAYQATKGQNHLRARVVYKYFMDMKRHFTAAAAHIKDGGYYCFTVGDQSRICGVEIPVASILAEMACEVGFRECFRFHVLLKNRRLNIPRNVEWAGTIKHDTTIVLEKLPSA